MNLKKAVNRQPSLGKWQKQAGNQGKTGRNFSLGSAAAQLSLSRAQLDALVLGLPWQRMGEAGIIRVV